MAGHDDRERDLPITWPFTFAGLLILTALVWFCLQYAVRDQQVAAGREESEGLGLGNFWPVFWGLLVAAVVIIVAGAVFNHLNGRRRRASEAD